jgi:TolB-like protein/class 3 adenylate cyclase/cytochrome c-type biogenesis protein CcmH/NrfG
VERRLAAILAADVVGYSRLIEADEAGTLATLKARRKQVLEPLLARHHGRLVKVMGDAALVEFASAVSAVECALALQRAMAEANRDAASDRAVLLRIGISLGDVVVEGSDLYGEGVIVATRLEAMAEPGGICVSGSVHQQVGRRLPVGFEDVGPQVLKNMANPVQVYRIHPAEGDRVPGPVPPVPVSPSIVVLPFINLSSDPEHEYFADGLTEDLITDLSQAAGLIVIARNSAFSYKGKQVDVRTIARDLGVRYVIEGSARRAAGRVRINVQLIDAIGGGHLWAERLDRDLDDIFKVQDEVVARIVQALIGRLTTTPMAERRRPASIEAYDLYVRGRALYLQSPESNRQAQHLFESVLAIDPEFAAAHRWLALILTETWMFWGEPDQRNRARALELANRAVVLDPNDSDAHWVLGAVLAKVRQWAEAEREYATALRLDRSNAEAWTMRSELMVLVGRSAEALANIEQALRLNPHPPGWYYWLLGQAEYLDRQYERAVRSLSREETYRSLSRRTLAAALAKLGRREEAKREAELFMINNPHFTISGWAATVGFQDEAALRHFIEGYREAGLPE